MNTYRDRDDARKWLAAAEGRFAQVVPDVWFAVNILYPKHQGKNLTTAEFRKGVNFLTTWYPNSKLCILDYIGGENEEVET